MQTALASPHLATRRHTDLTAPVRALSDEELHDARASIARLIDDKSADLRLVERELEMRRLTGRGFKLRAAARTDPSFVLVPGIDVAEEAVV